MSGALAAMIGQVSSGGFAVTANDVTRVQEGTTGIGTVTTVQLPNPAVTGGIAPLEYAWTYVSGSTVPACTDADIANPQWTGSVTDGAEEIAVWRLTVTDAGANTATVDIFVTLIWLNLS